MLVKLMKFGSTMASKSLAQCTKLLLLRRLLVEIDHIQYEKEEMAIYARLITIKRKQELGAQRTHFLHF